MNAKWIYIAGRKIAQVGVGALLGNVGASAVNAKLLTSFKSKPVNYIMSGVGALILGGMVGEKAADYVEDTLKGLVESVKDIPEVVKQINKEGEPNGNEISEQQQISSTEGGTDGATTGEEETGKA